MIIYSIIPNEVIFKEPEEKQNEGNLVEALYMGEKVIVAPYENNRYTIRRVISTSPKVYLDPNLQPGTIVNIP
ncbi:MAG TPA: YlzJ-like family protein [Clostridia bacterium]